LGEGLEIKGPISAPCGQGALKGQALLWAQLGS